MERASPWNIPFTKSIISDTIISSSPFKNKTALHGDAKCSIALIKSPGNFARCNDFISHLCGIQSEAFL